MKGWRMLAYLLALVMVLGGCGKTDVKNEPNSEEQKQTTDNTADLSEMFSERDYEATYDENSSVQITLEGDNISCSSNAVQINGSTVTITEEATYIFTGTLDDGMIVVNAKDTAKLQLVLNNASITSKTSAPIYILEADKVFITLAENSENILANGGEFVAIDDNNIDGTVFSKQDLTFNGSGSLTVTSPAGHGIVCKDDLVFTGGDYTVQSASHGLDANDSVRAVNATFSITSGKDGVHAENSEDTSLGFVYLASGTYDVSSEGDGISAGAYMQIEEGIYQIVSGGGSENASKQSSDYWGGFQGGGMGGHGGGGRKSGDGGYGAKSIATAQSGVETMEGDDSSTSIKGIKATQDIVINGGTFTLDCADDAIHSNASITVAEGSFQIKTGDDGFHADDTLMITDGTIDITESYEGLEGLHIDIQGGAIKLVSSDDGINAAGGTDESGYGGHRGNDMFGGMGGGSSSNGSITISGGSIYMNASGDGIDANGTLEITGGETVVCGPTQGDTAVLDYDKTATITGGTFIGTGSYMMAQTFSDSEQGVIALSVGSQMAGTEITLKDKDGKTLIECAPKLSYAIVILSSPDIEKGETYSVTVGEISGEFEAN